MEIDTQGDKQIIFKASDSEATCHESLKSFESLYLFKRQQKDKVI